MSLQVVDKARVIAMLVEGTSVRQTEKTMGLSVGSIQRLRSSDEVFAQMLEEAEGNAVQAVIDDAITNVRNRIKALGPKALEVLTEALESDDERTRLQAAKEVFRIGGVMKNDLHVRVGLEQVLQGGRRDNPALGD